jgi:uncharacterized protein (DUF983 family)
MARLALAWYGPNVPPSDSFQTLAGTRLGVRAGCRYLMRSLRLHCPVCGTRPIFLPVARVRNFDDWFRPLDGCPRCGYAYEREPGYFLLAIFGFNLGFAAWVGITVFTLLSIYGDVAAMPYWQLLAMTVLPIPLINLLIARHAKALFIALDHFVDPHDPHADDGSDDDDDGPSLITPPISRDGGGGEAYPEEALSERRELATTLTR